MRWDFVQTAALSELQRETAECGEAIAELQCQLKAAREQVEKDGARREELKKMVEVLKEEAAEKDRFLESALADKDLTFQQELKQREVAMQSELSRRDQELAKAVAQHQEALKEMKETHQIACQRLAKELQTEAATSVKAVEEQLQKQTLSAQQAVELVAQLQEECRKKEEALLAAQKETEVERAAKEEQGKAADAALAAMQEAMAVKELELKQLYEQKEAEMQKQLDAKDRHVVEVLLRREEEVKEHQVESQQQHQKLQEALAELEALRMRQAEVVEAAQQQNIEVEKLHTLRKQMEKKLLQMQLEGHRAVRTRAALIASTPEGQPTGQDTQLEEQASRQPGKQRRKETQMQVEWADQIHAALPESKESAAKNHADSSSAQSDAKGMEGGTPKVVSPKLAPVATSRSRRPRPSSTGSASADTRHCGASQPSHSAQSQAEGTSQGITNTDECSALGEDAMQPDDHQEADPGLSRRHSLRLRKQKTEVSPASITPTAGSPKPSVQSKKK